MPDGRDKDKNGRADRYDRVYRFAKSCRRRNAEEHVAYCAAANGGLGQVDFVLLDEEGRIVPMRERRPPAGRPPKNSAQRVIQRRQKKGRYRPPKRNRKGKLR